MALQIAILNRISPNFHTMDAKGKIKIFLVDDDLMFMESLKHVLNEDKADVKIFSNGEDCLKSMEIEVPEVVVMDYYLDGKSDKAMNGLQVMNKIKKSNPETEIIMVSGQDNVDVAVDILKYGAYDYITKEKSAFVKVRNDIKHIADKIEQSDDYVEKWDRLKVINITIAVVVIIIFILNRIF
jgi:two-component system OmpR family response regulator